MVGIRSGGCLPATAIERFVFAAYHGRPEFSIQREDRMWAGVRLVAEAPGLRGFGGKLFVNDIIRAIGRSADVSEATKYRFVEYLCNVGIIEREGRLCFRFTAPRQAFDAPTLAEAIAISLGIEA